jgi:ATP-dependent Clp protease ATP-binding subunit ClpA
LINALDLTGRDIKSTKLVYGHAARGHHEYATLEHLLLALIDDQDAAAAVMRACNDCRRGQLPAWSQIPAQR